MRYSKLYTVNVFLVLAAFSGCKSSQTGIESDGETNKTIPRLIFLTFNAISGDSSNRYNFISKTVTDGTLKRYDEKVAGSDYLKLSLLDARKKVIASTSHEHPLMKEVEYADVQGNLSRKKVTLPQSEFFVRMPYLAQPHWVEIEEYIASKKTQTLLFELTP